MTKQLMYLICISFITAHCSFNQLLINEISIPANRFINLVGRRYYHIIRLRQAVNLFKKIQHDLENHSKLINKETLFNFRQIEKFQHRDIRASFTQMQREKILTPLFLVWDDFVSFKCLDDQIFIEEFTKEVFIISANLLSSSKSNHKDIDSDITQGTIPLDQLLNLIGLYIDQFMSNYEHNTFKAITENLNDVVPLVKMDQVALRYYHIKRLYNPIKLLKLINAQHLLPHDKFKTAFHHPTIIATLQEVELNATFTPVLDLYQAIQHYKYIDDIELVREYSLLIACVYTKIISMIALKDMVPVKTKTDYFITLFDQLKDAPLEEILDALNLIADEFPSMLQQYELNSKLSWKQWFKKYWWAPPLIVATLALKIAIQHALYSTTKT